MDLGDIYGGDIASHCIVERLTAAWENDVNKALRTEWLAQEISNKEVCAGAYG